MPPRIWLVATIWAVVHDRVEDTLAERVEESGRAFDQAVVRIQQRLGLPGDFSGAVVADTGWTGDSGDTGAADPADSGESPSEWDTGSADTSTESADVGFDSAELPIPDGPAPDSGFDDTGSPPPDTAAPTEADTAAPPVPVETGAPSADTGAPPSDTDPPPSDSGAPPVADSGSTGLSFVEPPTDTAESGVADSSAPLDTAPAEVDPPACWEEIPVVARGVADLAAPNVIVVLLDDLGTELLGLYGSADPIPMPTLDTLADEGVVFERAYAAPVCSPTRAELVTGRLVPHHGIGGAIGAESESLSCAETTVGHVLRGAGYHVAHVGKWHLDAMDEGALIGPLAHGFDRFLGATANFDAAWATDGLGQNYRNWERVVDGLPTRIATYATTRNVDDALALANALPEPWWITVAFNAPHAPYHQPPTELLSGGPPGVDDVSAYRAAVEATDTEFGRLLDGLSGDVRARTQIWWTGDNGSPDDILGVPAKATPYETGTHVPLVVAGWGVAEPGRRSDHLIQVADILPTVAAQSGGSFSDAWWASLDGVSHAGVLSDPAALPAREFAYNGTSNVGDGVIVQESSFTRDDRWKLVRFFSIAYGADWWELYDMDGAGEADDLLLSPLSDEAVDAFDRLLAAHAAIWEPRPPAAP